MCVSGRPLTCKIECHSCKHLGCYNKNLKYPFVCYHPSGKNSQVESIPYCGNIFKSPNKILKHCRKLNDKKLF